LSDPLSPDLRCGTDCRSQLVAGCSGRILLNIEQPFPILKKVFPFQIDEIDPMRPPSSSILGIAG